MEVDSKKRVLDKSEVINLIKKTDNKQMKAIISTMILTGGRISEVLSIKAKDLWADNDYLYFKMLIFKKRGNVRPEIVRPVKRSIFFTKYIFDWINNENNFYPDDFIFEYRRQTVWKKIKEIEPDIHPHLLRHSLATWMGDKVNHNTMRDWFGWSNLNMAQRYIHNKDSINAFSNAMDGLE